MRQNLITDVPGLRVGHAGDEAALTGVTVIAVEQPNVAGVIVGGGAPGTRGLAILEPQRTGDGLDAVVLSGGSAFGLDASGGVMDVLRGKGIGFEVGPVRVPIVAQAITFDLLNGGKDWANGAPFYWHLGRKAALDAFETDSSKGAFRLGSVGGGLGATTATLKGGVGSASAITPSGFTIGAIAVVNAVGSATIGDSPHFWAGAFEKNGEFGGLGLPAQISADDLGLQIKGGAPPSTTIALVGTDAILTKAQAKRLAIMADDGLARAIRPAHAPMDGDTVFAVATQRKALSTPLALTELGAACADCLARAIARGVFHAERPPTGYAGPATWRERFGC